MVDSLFPDDTKSPSRYLIDWACDELSGFPPQGGEGDERIPPPQRPCPPKIIFEKKSPKPLLFLKKKGGIPRFLILHWILVKISMLKGKHYRLSSKNQSPYQILSLLLSYCRLLLRSPPLSFPPTTRKTISENLAIKVTFTICTYCL